MLKTSSLFIVQFKENAQLVEPIHYFASITAMLDKFPSEKIGAGAGAIYNSFFHKGMFENKKVRIIKDEVNHLIRAKQ